MDNGYELLRDGYKKLVADGKLTQQQAEPEIRMYDYLAGCSQDDIYRLVNTGAFNSIMRAYMSKACKDAGLAESDTDRLNASLRYMLDTQTAQEVME